MKNTQKEAQRAALEFSIQWQSPYGNHTDRWYAEKIDFWRDFFPGNMHQNVSVLSHGEKYSEAFAAGCLVPPYSEKNIRRFPINQFSTNKTGELLIPEHDRFYPKGYAWKALNSFPNDATPFRLVEVDNETLVADTNHPLAKFPITIHALMVERLQVANQRGGSANDVAALLTQNGPGMQIPAGRIQVNPYREYPFARNNTVDDVEFYRSPRFVHHLDSKARDHVQSIYARLLAPGMRVLDLMSSWESHLPSTLQHCQVTGIGLNTEELERNKQLSNFIIQDLNKTPLLPLSDNSFDVALCTVSIEYLLQPREVMAEVARVIRPGGIFVVISSDRWFPGKQILPWAHLHPFERQGLVLNYFLHEPNFADLHTESIRGYPRPVEDAYSHQMALSDSLFIVSGRRQN